MPEYISIKDEVLQTLTERLPEIKERFGIVTLGLFGSVSRGEDTKDSDIDFLYRFREGIRTYYRMLDLADYLEELFGRRVQLISVDWVDSLILPYIEEDVIFLCGATKLHSNGFERDSAAAEKSEA